MYSNIGNSGLNDYLGSSSDPCYIQNRVITNRVIKRLRCTFIFDWIFFILAGNKDNYIVSDKFEIGPDPSMDCINSSP